MRKLFSCAWLVLSLALGATTLAHAQAPGPAAPALPPEGVRLPPSEDLTLYFALKHKLEKQVDALDAALEDADTKAKIKELDSWLTDMATWENFYEGIRVTNPNPLNLEVNQRGYGDYARHARNLAEELSKRLIVVCSAPETTMRAMQSVVPDQYNLDHDAMDRIWESVDKSCQFLHTSMHRTSQFSIKSKQYQFDRRSTTPMTQAEADYLAARDVLEGRLYR